MPRNTTTIPFDRASDPNAPAYDALTADLAAAGRRARNRKAQLTHGRPNPAFADALRGRLLQPAGTGAGPLAPDVTPRPLPMATPVQAAARRGAAVALSPDARPGPLTRPRLKMQAGSTARRTSSPRLLALFGIGALVLALAAAGLVSGRFAIIPANRVGEAADATLIRAGGSQPLVAGSVLNAGDEIRVAADGQATLALGSSQARLAGGTDLRVNILSSSNVQLALLTGRAYNRVVLPAGGTYTVVTGPYSWTAAGTAFDLQRAPASTGGELVVALALEHALTIDGPETHQQVPEGNSASVLFGNPTSTGVTVGPIPTTDFSDPWLINNAKTDESLGYPIGALAGVALAPNGTPVASPSASPSDSPTDSPSDSPSLEPSPSDSPSLSPSPTPGLTPNPTPSASPSPSPTPTATPRPAFAMSTMSCPGGVVLSWSKYAGSGFARYITLRSQYLGIGKVYPQANTSVVASTSVQKRTTGADGTVADGSTYFYRTLVLDSSDHVLAASGVMNALGSAQLDLGELSVVTGTGGTSLSWTFYGQASQPIACFSEYRLLYAADHSPTVGDSLQYVASRLQSSMAIPANWVLGKMYYYRIQVVRLTAVGSFVVGQTGLASHQY